MKKVSLNKQPFFFWCTLLLLCTASCSEVTPREQEEQKHQFGTEQSSPYLTEVLEYMPGVGQLVNKMPQYTEGDTQESMNNKALAAIGAEAYAQNKAGMITLGSFGGYVTVKFDHTIENKPGLCDFRVLGNAFISTQDSTGGSCEPGVIQVALDENHNGRPDEDEWREIAGSVHRGQKEKWYAAVEKAGGDTRLIKEYAITYHRPQAEPKGDAPEYIRWEANRQQKGVLPKNRFHNQSYYPKWIKEDTTP